MRPRRRIALALFPSLLALAAGAAHAEDAYVAAMEHAHHGDAATPSPAASPEPRVPVTTEEVVYATFGSKQVKGYLAKPADAKGPLPGLIVIQEWWGLNDQIRSMARRFAGEGYVALAVDLYEGKVATSAEEAGAAMTEVRRDGARLVDHLRQARGYLATTAKATRIGSVGWCFGGAMSLEAAIELGDDLDAAVVYYGRPVSDPVRLTKIAAPILGLYGGADQGIPVDGVRAMEAELKKLGRPIEVVVYEGADHAFANPTGTRYQEKAATDAWQRATDFLARHLKP